MSSLCDVCDQPGNCCKDFVISFIENKEPHFVEEEILTLANIKMALHGFPFIATRYEKSKGARFMCPLLDADGYCSDYENRPKLCREYKPQTDKMCVFFEG